MEALLPEPFAYLRVSHLNDGVYMTGYNGKTNRRPLVKFDGESFTTVGILPYPFANLSCQARIDENRLFFATDFGSSAHRFFMYDISDANNRRFVFNKNSTNEYAAPRDNGLVGQGINCGVTRNHRDEIVVAIFGEDNVPYAASTYNVERDTWRARFADDYYDFCRVNANSGVVQLDEDFVVIRGERRAKKERPLATFETGDNTWEDQNVLVKSVQLPSGVLLPDNFTRCAGRYNKQADWEYVAAVPKCTQTKLRQMLKMFIYPT